MVLYPQWDIVIGLLRIWRNKGLGKVLNGVRVCCVDQVFAHFRVFPNITFYVTAVICAITWMHCDLFIVYYRSYQTEVNPGNKVTSPFQLHSYPPHSQMSTISKSRLLLSKS